MPSQVFPRPHFVIVGARAADAGVMIIASESLTEFSLILEDFDADWTGARRNVLSTTYRLNGVLHDFVIARGADYGEAFRNLWEHWNPDVPQAELGAGQRALPPSP